MKTRTLLPMEVIQENRAQLYSVSFPSGEKRRFTNDLSDYGPTPQVTKDGQMLATLARRRTAHIWVVPQGRSELAKQIAAGETPDDAVSPGPGWEIAGAEGQRHRNDE